MDVGSRRCVLSWLLLMVVRHSQFWVEGEEWERGTRHLQLLPKHLVSRRVRERRVLPGPGVWTGPAAQPHIHVNSVVSSEMCDSHGGAGFGRKGERSTRIAPMETPRRQHAHTRVRTVLGGMKNGTENEELEATFAGAVFVRSVCAVCAPHVQTWIHMICARAPRRAPYVCSKIPAEVTPRNSSARPHVRTSAPHSREGCMGAGKSRERGTILDGDAGGCVPLLPDSSDRVSSGKFTPDTNRSPPTSSTRPHHIRSLSGGSLFNLRLTRVSKTMNTIDWMGPDSPPSRHGCELAPRAIRALDDAACSTGTPALARARHRLRKRVNTTLRAGWCVFMKHIISSAHVMSPLPRRSV